MEHFSLIFNILFLIINICFFVLLLYFLFCISKKFTLNEQEIINIDLEKECNKNGEFTICVQEINNFICAEIGEKKFVSTKKGFAFTIQNAGHTKSVNFETINLGGKGGSFPGSGGGGGGVFNGRELIPGEYVQVQKGGNGAKDSFGSCGGKGGDGGNGWNIK